MTLQQVRDSFVQSLAENAYLNMCTTEEMNIAINAIEKQIPKKIELEGVPSETFVEKLKGTYAFEHVGICPNCNYINIKALAIKCCCNCGQAIDWSDD